MHINACIHTCTPCTCAYMRTSTYTYTHESQGAFVLTLLFGTNLASSGLQIAVFPSPHHLPPVEVVSIQIPSPYKNVGHTGLATPPPTTLLTCLPLEGPYLQIKVTFASSRRQSLSIDCGHQVALGCTQASAFPPSSCVSGLITNCSSWPCEEGEESFSLCPCLTPGSQGSGVGWETSLRRAEAEVSWCLPTWSHPLLSSLSSVYPKASLHGQPGLHGVCVQPLVALPDATGTASVPGPPRGHPSPSPQWLPLQPSARALRLRKSRASCQDVIVSRPLS